MKVVILAGGLPSNISDENDRIPKPMVRIGERPILWHIMKLYSHYGFHDFIICAGYRGEMIKHYFMDYYMYRSDITVDLKNNDITIHNNVTEPWNVTIVHTGMTTATARRIEKVLTYIDGDDFVVSYGDCISNINIQDMIQTHKLAGKDLTVALAHPTGRNAILHVSDDGGLLNSDTGAAKIGAWVNACNMVVRKAAFQGRTVSRDERLEIETLQSFAERGQVASYKHEGFWLPVETMRDKTMLQTMWDSGNIPWKIWK